MNWSSIPFEEVRALLRKCVQLGNSGIPAWGSESIIRGTVTPEDLLVVNDKMTEDTYEKAVNIFTEIEMAGLVGTNYCHALLNNETREFIFPPVIEYFGDDPVLLFGYESLYWLAGTRTTSNSVPAILVHRTVMKQVPNDVIEKTWPSTVHLYTALTDWKIRESSERRFFVFDN